jgi:hypothetical protein
MKTEWKAFLADAGAEFANDAVTHFGNPELEQEVALTGLVFADLDFHGVIAAHGGDAGTFLQSQLTNDISRLDASGNQLNAYCTPKGRIMGLMRVFRRDDIWYLRLPTDTLEAVLQRLRMFILRAAVTLEDVSGNFIRIGVAGEAAPAELLAVTGMIPDRPGQTVITDKLVILRVPGILPRFEVYADSLDAARSLWDSLNVRGAPVGSSAWRLQEILAGIPNVYAATTEMFVPQMTNLQLVDGVSFKKGCYPGQEIVARMQYLGTLKRRMYLGSLEMADVPLPGDPLFSGSDNEQPVGRIVDAQPHPDGGQSTLAVIQIRYAEQDDVHLGASNGPAFSRQPLPYAFAD